MNELQVFKSGEFGKVRIVTINGEPWFSASDVGKILQHTNIRKVLCDRVDDEDKRVLMKSTIVTLDAQSGNPVFDTVPNRGMTFVNEPGLYSLILCSTLPSAKKFKRWITHDVIPSVRKHGAYMTSQTLSELISTPEGLNRFIDILTNMKDGDKATSANILA